MASLTHYLDYHPGNLELIKRIKGAALTFQFLDVTGRSRLVDFIKNETHVNGHNFLFLRDNAQWTVATSQEAASFVLRTFTLEGRSLLSKLTRTALTLLYELKYGIFNSQKSIFSFLQNIMTEIFERNGFEWLHSSRPLLEETKQSSLRANRTLPYRHFPCRRYNYVATTSQRTFSSPVARSAASRVRTHFTSRLAQETVPVMLQGSVVYAQYEGEHNEVSKKVARLTTSPRL